MANKSHMGLRLTFMSFTNKITKRKKQSWCMEYTRRLANMTSEASLIRQAGRWSNKFPKKKTHLDIWSTHID